MGNVPYLKAFILNFNKVFICCPVKLKAVSQIMCCENNRFSFNQTDLDILPKCNTGALASMSSIIVSISFLRNMRS